jgi:signal transduction histidine kinase
VVLIRRRLRSLVSLDRQIFAPVMVGAIAPGIAVAMEVASALLPVGPDVRAAFLVIEAVALLAIPASFLVAAVRRRLTRSTVADLVVQLAHPGTLEEVRDALRGVLSDPRLEVCYWVTETERFVTSEGRPADAQLRDPHRLVVEVMTSDNAPLAAVQVDPALGRHREMLDAALAAAGLALENARLQASVRAQLEEVRASRARIVEASVTERRRLERDLHDGAQQRLLALTMTVAAAQAKAAPEADAALMNTIRTELHQTLRELRELAHGIHPAVLSQAGLGPAVTVVAERMPIDVEIDVPPRRWEPAVEATAYFLACEAIVNAVKYAAATTVVVRVRSEPGCLGISVIDNGVGGADPGAGTGLNGLRDRVLALGGALDLTSPIGGGTTVHARLPCA